MLQTKQEIVIGSEFNEINATSARNFSGFGAQSERSRA